jgi:hypothetical protein
MGMRRLGAPLDDYDEVERDLLLLECQKTYYSVKRDIVQCQKTYYSVKRDLVQCHKRPSAVSKET